MSDRPACRCGQPAEEGFICDDCFDQLKIDLVAVTNYLPELAVLLTRQARTSRGQGRHQPPEPESSEDHKLIPALLRTAAGPIALSSTPLLFDLTAADAQAEARMTLKSLCTARGIPNGLDLVAPPNHIERTMTRALVGDAIGIRNDPEARDHWRAIHRLATRLERVIDNSTPDVYAGLCDGPVVESVAVDGFVKLRLVEGATCGAGLYCKVGEPMITCTECGSTYEFNERWSTVSDLARDHWARPRVIVDLLRAWGANITFDRLKMWISRDKAEAESGRRRRATYPPILQVGIDDNGRALYRVGDIIDRVEALSALTEQKRETMTA